MRFLFTCFTMIETFKIHLSSTRFLFFYCFKKLRVTCSHAKWSNELFWVLEKMISFAEETSQFTSLEHLQDISHYLRIPGNAPIIEKWYSRKHYWDTMCRHWNTEATGKFCIHHFSVWDTALYDTETLMPEGHWTFHSTGNNCPPSLHGRLPDLGRCLVKVKSVVVMSISWTLQRPLQPGETQDLSWF